jgi:uncharacterized lipoprotein YmbA
MNALKDRIVVALIGALCAGLLIGCAAQSPAPVLLTLPPVTTSGASAMAPEAPGSAPLLVVRRVNIPEYLVARRVRYRTDSSTLAEWPNTYWAERIEIGVSREFISALRQQLPGWALCEANCGDQVPALNLAVDVQQLDYLRAAQKLQAGARVSVSGPGASSKTLQSQYLTYELSASGDTPQAQAQATAQLIEKLASSAAQLVRSSKP